jgi:hypothetical protein
MRVGHVILTTFCFFYSIYLFLTTELPGEKAKHVQQGRGQISWVSEEGGRGGGREGGREEGR